MLFLNLRYQKYSKNSAYIHAERKVIFLGDFIDRGPQQIETALTAKAMIESGSLGTVTLSLASSEAVIIYHVQHPRLLLLPPCFPAEIIAEAVWLYFGCTVSYRMV